MPSPETVTLAWQVPLDHPSFPGHFPGRPILPGVALLDRALLDAARHFGLDAAMLRVASTKFLSPVAPGETLTLVLQRKANGSVQFDIRGKQRTVASGAFATRSGETA